VADACRHVPIPRKAVGADGLITDVDARAQIAATIQAVLDGQHPAV